MVKLKQFSRSEFSLKSSLKLLRKPRIGRNLDTSFFALINVLVSAIRIKIFALLLAPAAFGTLGILQNLVGLLGIAANYGTATSATSMEKQKLKDAIGSIFTFTSSLSFIFLLILFVLPLDLDGKTKVLVGILALFLNLTQTMYGIRVRNLGGKVQRVLLASSVLSLLSSAPLVWFLQGNATLQIWTILISQFTISFLIMFFAEPFQGWGFLKSSIPSRETFKEFLGSNSLIVMSSICPLLLLLIVRLAENKIWGAEAAGNLNAIIVFAGALSPVVLAPITTNFYQEYAKHKNPSLIKTQIIYQSVFLPFMAFAALLLYEFGKVFFSEAFSFGFSSIVLMLSGEIFRMYSHVFSYAKISEGRLKTLLVVDLIPFGLLLLYASVFTGLNLVTGAGFYFVYFLSHAIANALSR